MARRSTMGRGSRRISASRGFFFLFYTTNTYLGTIYTYEWRRQGWTGLEIGRGSTPTARDAALGIFFHPGYILTPSFFNPSLIWWWHWSSAAPCICWMVFTFFTKPQSESLSISPLRDHKGKGICSIIPIGNIRRSVHLLPKFGSAAPAEWTDK